MQREHCSPVNALPRSEVWAFRRQNRTQLFIEHSADHSSDDRHQGCCSERRLPPTRQDQACRSTFLPPKRITEPRSCSPRAECRVNGFSPCSSGKAPLQAKLLLNSSTKCSCLPAPRRSLAGWLTSSQSKTVIFSIRQQRPLRGSLTKTTGSVALLQWKLT